MLVGTDGDPQNLGAQAEQLAAAGALVEYSNESAARRAGEIVARLNPLSNLPAVDLAAINAPFAAINVGLQSFAGSLAGQGAPVVPVDWRPPAGGNEKLMGILARLKSK